MKTLRLFLMAALVCCTRVCLGDGTPYVPASQAEVNAGTLRTKFVSPATLVGFSSAGAPAATVTQIVNANAILQQFGTGNSNTLKNLTIGGPVVYTGNGTNIVYVDSVNGSDTTNRGTSWQDAVQSLTNAFNIAEPIGATVWLHPNQTFYVTNQGAVASNNVLIAYGATIISTNMAGGAFNGGNIITTIGSLTAFGGTWITGDLTVDVGVIGGFHPQSNSVIYIADALVQQGCQDVYGNVGSTHNSGCATITNYFINDTINYNWDAMINRGSYTLILGCTFIDTENASVESSSGGEMSGIKNGTGSGDCDVVGTTIILKQPTNGVAFQNSGAGNLDIYNCSSRMDITPATTSATAIGIISTGNVNVYSLSHDAFATNSATGGGVINFLEAHEFSRINAPTNTANTSAPTNYAIQNNILFTNQSGQRQFVQGNMLSISQGVSLTTLQICLTNPTYIYTNALQCLLVSNTPTPCQDERAFSFYLDPGGTFATYWKTNSSSTSAMIVRGTNVTGL